MSESNTASVPPTIITPASTSTPKGDTSYVLLESETSDSPGDWIELGTYTGRDAESVIKQYVGQINNATKTYVAVSARHWRPVTPTIEVVTTRLVTLKAEA